MSQPDRQTRSSFAEQAEKRQTSLLSELWSLLRQNKKWWLAPIVVLLLAAALLVVLGGSAVAPLIYTVF